ncbi:MAG TPA: hypothetical protein VNB49_02660 [Candidatus Dormibacteraeota bacterium]|nr:hypothetical protein [Candidatus Dormibacteraeota bacterium]
MSVLIVGLALIILFVSVTFLVVFVVSSAYMRLEIQKFLLRRRPKPLVPTPS